MNLLYLYRNGRREFTFDQTTIRHETYLTTDLYG